jgi:hypothetical protein
MMFASLDMVVLSLLYTWPARDNHHEGIDPPHLFCPHPYRQQHRADDNHQVIGADSPDCSSLLLEAVTTSLACAGLTNITRSKVNVKMMPTTRIRNCAISVTSRKNSGAASCSFHDLTI